MLPKNEVVKIYETLLSMPGMSDSIKISFSIPRKNVLLLSKLIERGLSGKEPDDKSMDILDIVQKETLQELKVLPGDLLEKAGLTAMNEKLQSL